MGTYKVDICGVNTSKKEEIVYALDAIQTPLSLFDPVYTDSGDTLYVMDQISDKKNKEENWIEDLSLSSAMKQLNDRDEQIIRLRFLRGRPRLRWLRKYTFLRHKSQD